MYGTDLDSTYWSGSTHTCNYIDNSASPKGDSYVIVTLPFYLEIKEIYNMGDKQTEFYLLDPLDTFINVAGTTYVGDISLYPNVKLAASTKGVDS
jgi:hypothetical protein